MLKVWPQAKVRTWSEKVVLYISQAVLSAWTHLWCFHSSSWSLSKFIAEKLLVTFRGMKWPWRRDEGSLVAIFRLRVSSLPVTWFFRVFRMVFVQKRRLSFFFHWRIKERSQNLPALRSLISKFRDIRFITTVTDIKVILKRILKWKFQGDRSFGVAMPSIQTFFEVRSLDVTWWPHLEWLGSEILTKLWKRCINRCTKNGGASFF